MAEYHLLTIWRIEAPLVNVYAAIHDTPCWPNWWPGVRKVEQETSGDADGVNSLWRYSWQGHLPYRVVFEVYATRVEQLVAIEGIASGDLEGTGRWNFSSQGEVSVVRCEWHVRTTLWWMNLIAPLARSMFIRNHTQVMTEGGAGLARQLQSRLLSQENIDLMAVSSPDTNALVRRQAPRKIKPGVILVVGIVAGVVVSVTQIVLWWLTHRPLAQTFFRDVQLTAAMVMGSAVLAQPATPQWNTLLVAALIHFALSVAYALILAHLLNNMRATPALFTGALYGMLIYGVNLYGMTLFFPWFAVSRDWVTLLAHIVFGVALAGGYRLFSREV